VVVFTTALAIRTKKRCKGELVELQHGLWYGALPFSSTYCTTDHLFVAGLTT
jgi:hypothetical protein